jgi:hypothetical protein
MKTSFIKQEKAADIPYPKLMVSKSDPSLIVLLRDRTSGVVVNENKHWKIGTYLEFWDNNCLENYNGEVIMQND